MAFSGKQINKQIKKNARVHVFISGQVQGVFYREETLQKALALGVSGWVRNLADTRVEAVFERDKDRVKEMINWAKHGSVSAKVEKFDMAWEEYKGEFQGFEIKHDF